MRLDGPASLREEHGDLHAVLTRATREPGALGEAAREVSSIMHPHFLREQQFAMPLLALLPEIVEGGPTIEHARVTVLTDRLKQELPTMRQEHRLIVAALHKLLEAARAADKIEYTEFARKLIQHARTEEEVLYPAAILVGEYIKLRLT
jgi:hypothetical protein